MVRNPNLSNGQNESDVYAHANKYYYYYSWWKDLYPSFFSFYCVNVCRLSTIFYKKNCV